MSGLFLVFSFITEIPVFNANSLDPNRTPRSKTETNLDLHCLSMSFYWTIGIKWLIRSAEEERQNSSHLGVKHGFTGYIT